MDDSTLALIIIGDMTLSVRKMEAEIIALRSEVERLTPKPEAEVE